MSEVTKRMAERFLEKKFFIFIMQQKKNAWNKIKILYNKHCV